MVCFHPRRAPAIGGPAHMGYLPCGQCVACVVNTRRVWTARQLLESEGQRTWFITLTYNDEHLPPEVQKAEIQKFMKRIRKNTGQKFRYFACAEYGDKYGRPHFHLNLFGYEPSIHTKIVRNKQGQYVQIMQCHHIAKAWQSRGYHTMDIFTDHRAAYVANYVTKKLNKKIRTPDDSVLPPEDNQKQPEFALMSRMPGIGAKKFLEFCTTRTMANFMAKNPEVAEVPRVFQRHNKFWPVGHYLRKYVHERTGYPMIAEVPVQIIAGQEKLKDNYENKKKASNLEKAIELKHKAKSAAKKSTSHV